MEEKIFEELREALGGKLETGTSARHYTTYRAGGAFEALAKPGNAAELSAAFRIAAAWNIPVRILGKGSNVLVSDSGAAGITVFTGMLDKISVPEYAAAAGGYAYAAGEGGASWDNFVLQCCKNGLSGYEKLSGIPGSIGGALRMNAGAYGQETADCLESFSIMSPDGKITVLQRNETEFSYRHSGFPADCAVISARFRLRRADPAELLRIRQETLAARRSKQPLEYPSAGSVFRRPPGDYASRLIDECGLKGMAIGCAQISEKHAGFIINRGNASASDIYALIQKAKEIVKQKTGTDLQMEQVLWGEFSAFSADESYS